MCMSGWGGDVQLITNVLQYVAMFIHPSLEYFVVTPWGGWYHQGVGCLPHGQHNQMLSFGDMYEYICVL